MAIGMLDLRRLLYEQPDSRQLGQPIPFKEVFEFLEFPQLRAAQDLLLKLRAARGGQPARQQTFGFLGGSPTVDSVTLEEFRHLALISTGAVGQEYRDRLLGVMTGLPNLKRQLDSLLRY